jgi:spore germination protein GerM
MAQKKKSSKKKNSTLFAAACVLLGLLVILIIFLVKKDQIFTNLKETAFFDRVFGSTPTAIEKHEPAEPKKTETIPLKNDEVTIKIETEETPAPKYSEPEPTAEATKPVETVKPAESAKPAEKKPEEPKKEAAKPAATGTSELQLCFVNIDGDGSVVRQVIKRKVPKSDSPLTTAINLLLKGPDSTISGERNLMSLIPAGTKLLSAKVQGGVAYLNFNEAFEINTYGVEGYIHQLEQIVYTATAFSTVNSVQFLIEGEKRDYLGSEGVLIASPLSRSSF